MIWEDFSGVRKDILRRQIPRTESLSPPRAYSELRPATAPRQSEGRLVRRLRQIMRADSHRSDEPNENRRQPQQRENAMGLLERIHRGIRLFPLSPLTSFQFQICSKLRSVRKCIWPSEVPQTMRVPA